MKLALLGFVVLVSACTQQQAGDFWPTQLNTSSRSEVKTVTVLGRKWTVYPSAEQEAVYVAQRDNLDLNPYGAPSALHTSQAVRAVTQATGCRVNVDAMIQDSSARFFVPVTCG